MIIRPNPLSGAQAWSGPYDSKKVRNTSRTTGAKNDAGNEVNMSVLVRSGTGISELGYIREGDEDAMSAYVMVAYQKCLTEGGKQAYGKKKEKGATKFIVFFQTLT